MRNLFCLAGITLAASTALFAQPAVAETWLDMEAGAFKPANNRVQIPNNSQGDRFKITDLGNDAFAGGRVTFGWLPTDDHELQLVYAPLVYKERGTFNQDIRFDGATFNAGDDVEARYQFSSYRLRYLYHWLKKDRWTLDVGATLFVRDAGIRLSSANAQSEDTDLGVVPLFAVRGTYQLNESWSAVVDADIAASPQGRAIDLALLGQYKVSDKLNVSGGYRTIEGGADTDDIYNFAWFNGVTFKATYKF